MDATRAPSTITIEYDCGFKFEDTIPLHEGQALLAHAALGDYVVSLADSHHAAFCTTCATLDS